MSLVSDGSANPNLLVKSLVATGGLEVTSTATTVTITNTTPSGDRVQIKDYGTGAKITYDGSSPDLGLRTIASGALQCGSSMCVTLFVE